MDNKFFGIGPTYRSTIPDAKRATGFGATQEPFEYINQALFELKTDHIIGTAAQLAVGSCTCKYQSSDQTLRDSSGTEVTLTDGDRVYIIGLDTLTADFDLSAYDRLTVVSDKSVSLANSSQDLVFGDDCIVDLKVDKYLGVTMGTNPRGYKNGKSFDCPAGSIKALGGDVVPDGWAECNGQFLSRTDDSDLFEVIGVNCGQGDGTTFAIPDLRGRVIRGWSHGTSKDPDRAARTQQATGGNTGDNVGSIQGDAMQRITGETQSGANNREIWITQSGVFGSDTPFAAASANSGNSSGDVNLLFDSANSTSPNAAKTSEYETRMTNQYAMYIIKR